VAAPWLATWRPVPPDRLAASVLRVTSSADSGPGSLREAIFAADRADGRTRIVVAVPSIVLAAGLPPLVNPSGIVLEAEQSFVELTGPRVAGPLLDVASPRTMLSGFRIVGAPAGVVVRAPGATLRNLTIVDGETGVLVGEGADQITIEASVFARNRIGVHVSAPSGRVSLRGNRFDDHRLAGIWAVAAQAGAPEAPQIVSLNNRYRDNANGLVAVNVVAHIERDVFDGHRDAAVHVSGARAVIRGNTIRGGRRFGVYAERLSSGVITGNEIARNCAGGLMVRNVRNTEVLTNQLYQNGFGIVLMEGGSISPNTVAGNLITDHVEDGLVLIASSPLVRRNRLLRNRRAGLRLSSLVAASGETQTPQPLLSENVLSGNGYDDPLRDQYVNVSPPAATAAADCGWRLGAMPPRLAQNLETH
ncbi:MAG: right-handed parallel beta-helix repeat-containing protein, partial [Vicinamibacterales bacterium]